MDPNTKITMIKAQRFKSSTLVPKIQRIKSNAQEIKIDRSWISSFANPIKINMKNVMKIDGNGKISIKIQSLRNMSARL